MNKPQWVYCVAGPKKVIPIDATNAYLPLEGDRAKTPYMRYFETIKTFLSQDNFYFLSSAIAQQTRQPFSDFIQKIVIRAEKHGAFYHPARIEVYTEEKCFVFGVNVATEKEKAVWLKREYALLNTLHQKFSYPYLPRVYTLADLNDMTLTLVEWFEDYHEFHLTLVKNKHPQIVLWDFKRGYRYLSEREAFSLFQEIAYILSLYYNFSSFAQIYPWHHAAGDFIVRADEEIKVRLTTVRGYEPFIEFLSPEEVNPILALIYFFLNLSLRIRLDRFDGVGQIGLFDSFYLKAVLVGFLKAMQKRKEELKAICQLDNTELLNLLRAFSQEELNLFLNQLLCLYEGKEEFSVLEKNLPQHTQALFQAIQAFPE